MSLVLVVDLAAEWVPEASMVLVVDLVLEALALVQVQCVYGACTGLSPTCIASDPAHVFVCTRGCLQPSVTCNPFYGVACVDGSCQVKNVWIREW